MTKCHECSDTGERDSGGTHPWGEPVYVPCDCKDAEIGRRWRADNSLEKWFPITAEQLAALKAENAALKHDLQYARDGLTKGRTRMREDNERLRRALHEIAEEWAGAECGEPVHAQEAYAIALAKRMYALAAAALRPNAELNGAPPGASV